MLIFESSDFNSDNNGMSGLHNSHPHVIASQSYVWTNISFKSAPFYDL